MPDKDGLSRREVRIFLGRSSRDIATTWHCHGYSFSDFFLGTRLVDRQSERVGSGLLRLFTPQAAEASRIHLSSPLAAAACSCLSSEKISDPQK